MSRLSRLFGSEAAPAELPTVNSTDEGLSGERPDLLHRVSKLEAHRVEPPLVAGGSGRDSFTICPCAFYGCVALAGAVLLLLITALGWLCHD